MKRKSRFSNTTSIINSESDPLKSGNFSNDYESEVFVSDLESNSTKSKVSKLYNKEYNPSIISQTSLKKTMLDRLETGINTAIAPTNKGFSLLQKLGYNGSGGLGKDSSGIVVPITIAIDVESSQHKSGIGIAEEKKKTAEKFRSRMIELQNMREDLTNSYKNRLRYENEVRKMKKDIRSAEKVIHEYDCRYSVAQHNLWPKNIINEANQDDLIESIEFENDGSLEDDEPLQRLEQCLSYLRENYYYCLYCGCKYDSVDELLTNCPGILADDH